MFYTQTLDPDGTVHVPIGATEHFEANEDATQPGVCTPWTAGEVKSSLGVVKMVNDPVHEDVFWIHIRDGGGAVHVLQKSDLSKLDRELEATLMPSYASRFSAAELDDLVAYLSTLRGPS